ncbi:glycosyltransferase, partial [uncultured Helicobacter sp.]
LLDKRIRIVHNPCNLGTFHARARGILEAKGEYCMFADPDDYLALNACEVAYHTIEEKQVDIVHFGIDYKPRELKRIKPIVHKGRLEGEAMRYFLSAGNNTQSLCDKIYPKKILLQALKSCEFAPPLNMLEDGLLVLVASLHSHSYYGISQSLYTYCHNPQSITKDKSPKRLAQKQYFLDKLLHITSHLCILYPHHHALIYKYQRKVASTLMIESRDFSSFELYASMQILNKHGFSKTCDIPPYVKSTILSLLYAFRWQNCVRLFVFICSFGKWRL